jgi:hypothetical protein
LSTDSSDEISEKKQTKKTHKNILSEEDSNRRNDLEPKDIVERAKASPHPLIYRQARTYSAEFLSVSESRLYQADHVEQEDRHLRRNDPADHEHWVGQEGFDDDGSVTKEETIRPTH